jgi:RNA polymerase sigma-70 factor (ECF subfamily)
MPSEKAIVRAFEVAVERARTGDPVAQRRLFDDHKDRVAGQLMRMTGDPSIVDDLVQDVFISAFAGLTHFRGESALDTWLHRIAINKVRSHYQRIRRRKKRERLGLANAAASTEPDEVAEQRRHLDRLYDALADLPAPLREAFVARAIEGMTLERASELLEVPISTVSYRTRRAESLLCRLLEIET